MTQTRGPLLMSGILLILVAVVLLISGLLGELVVRTYYESQGKHIYYVRNVFHKDAKP